LSSPVVTITDVSTYKVSDKEGKDTCLATFEFDKAIQEYTVNVLGTSHETGTVADREGKLVSDMDDLLVTALDDMTVEEARQFNAEVPITADIDNTELYQEGDNRVNVYGKDLDGNWTPYWE
jgi:hypothetical protein